ncbi:MAG: type II and III secretion system protein family protein [Rhizomicrobium sp.]|jgi:pilus assembly protein CpaC
MRRGILTIALSALLALTFPTTAAETLQGNVESSGSRLITVTARGSGPVVEHLTLGRHKAAIVQLDTDARDVLVSDPKILDAVIKTPRRVFLLGTETGQASAYFFDGSGRQILTLDVRVERDVSELERVIRETIPDANVKITALNDDIVLTGTVPNAIEATRIYNLALRYAVDPSQQVDPTKVENMISVKGREQVMLKVRIAEMAHNISKQFAVNLSAAGSLAGVPLIAQTANPYGLIGSALSAASGAQIGSVGSNPLAPGPNNVQGLLNALDQVGLAHTLAEPNLTAVSGETAKFLAGGEFPVPVSRDQFGNVTVDFKQFGVGLSFTPVVESENRISLQMSTEVSELTNEGAFLETVPTGSNSAAGLNVPALAVRRAETTVELPSGGSFAIAGLLQNTTKQVIDAFPGLKDMPVLGALFRSRDFQNNETELVVIVSAYIVDPVHETKLAAPTDGFVPATDLDTIVGGRLNRVYKTDAHGLKYAGDGNAGFIVQ